MQGTLFERLTGKFRSSAAAFGNRGTGMVRQRLPARQDSSRVTCLFHRLGRFLQIMQGSREEEPMQRHDHDPTGKLHPWIFRILMGFVGGWLIITYSFFLNTNGGGRAYGAIIALIVSVFGLVVLLIPTSIRRIALNHPIGRN